MDEKADGSVLIKCNVDTSGADKELARLRQKALRLEESLTVGRHKCNQNRGHGLMNKKFKGVI